MRGGDELGEELGRLFLVGRLTRVLELGEELNKGLAEGRHDVGRIAHGEAADELDGELADGKDLVFERNKERSEDFGLSEVVVEAVVE